MTSQHMLVSVGERALMRIGFVCDPISHVIITSPCGQEELIANKQLSKITRVS